MTGEERTGLSLRPEGRFDFQGTAYSHGWVVLPPNAWLPESATVHRVLRLGTGRVVRLEITGEGDPPDQRVAVRVRHRGPLEAGEEGDVRRAVRRMFRLDEDLSGFHELCDARGDRWARASRGLGRLLRSPTLFEDVVKTICTTNIQWGGTKRMVGGLVREYGEPLPEALAPGEVSGGTVEGEPAGADPPLRAFPTPGALAAPSPEELADRAGLGYRAPWVSELARRVAEGELDLRDLEGTGRPTAELRAEMEQWKGVGSYASATILMFLGRYGELAVDSVFRDFVARRHFGGETPTDAEARAVYEEWGEWKFLAYWLELWEGT
jgi:3-methyladenine DNA glycosylase/8-oxoguanine DNA glycosylase